MDFGKRLYDLRQQQNMSQEAAAEALNVSRQTISKWENGSVNPDMYNLEAISKLFGVTTDYLIMGKPTEADKDNSESLGAQIKNLFREENRSKLKSVIKKYWLTALIVWCLLCITGWGVVSLIPLLLVTGAVVPGLYPACLAVILLILIILTVYHKKKGRNMLMCKLAWVFFAVILVIVGFYAAVMFLL